jgi:ParB-like chromosome segregation protein Spo0J
VPRAKAAEPEAPPGIPPTLASLAEPLDTLKPRARNPRRGDVSAIRESLQRHGQYRPIVANQPTREVLVGNHTLAAARELGWTDIAVTWVDVDDETASRIVIVDNRTSDLAGWDDALLSELLRDLPDLVGTGYDQRELDALLAKLAPPDEFPDPELGDDAYQCPSCGYEWSGQPRLGAGGE